LIATGEGRRKMEVFQGKNFEPADQLPTILSSHGSEFVNPLNEKVLSVGTQLNAPLHWSILVEQPIREAYALARKIRLLLIGMMVLILVLAFGLGLFEGRRNVVNPIAALTRATEELAKGNLEYRVSLKTGDEFSQLGEAFNLMAYRLKDLQEKLIREERHAVFGKIASGLAHDLKHPIQAIETTSRLMDKLYDDADFRVTYQKTVEREFSKINAFLQNLHNLTHEIPFHPVPTPLNALLDDALATFEPEAAKKGIQVVKNYPADTSIVQVDPAGLNRVLSNLISNALQAMNKGGRLTLSAEKSLGEVEIKVQDTGMGIPEDRMKTLFDDFVTTKRHGLGLGLAITRKIVSQHHGTVQVESRLGEGSAFKLRLPLQVVG
jgi:signal transduction histidine kinase